MKLSGSICSAAATGLLVLALAAPSVSFALDQACPFEEHQQVPAEEQGQWIKHQTDREAAWLEIKASQQTAWEAYTAANIELITAYDNHKPLAPDVDAASAMRQHAEHAAAFAQSLSKLADATQKLQSVLNEDQRKVLDRIVRMHSQFQSGRFGVMGENHEHWHHHHGFEPAPGASKALPKTPVPAKPKN